MNENLLELVVVVATQFCEYAENQAMTLMGKFVNLYIKLHIKLLNN